MTAKIISNNWSTEQKITSTSDLLRQEEDYFLKLVPSTKKRNKSMSGPIMQIYW